MDHSFSLLCLIGTAVENYASPYKKQNNLLPDNRNQPLPKHTASSKTDTPNQHLQLTHTFSDL